MIKMFPIALAFVSTAAVAEGQTLSGAEIRDKIVGNTLVGTEDGAPVVEFFKDDGSILGRGADGKYAGLWQIRGDKLCVHYDDDKAGSMDCMAMATNGDQVTRLSAGDDVDDDDNDDIWTLKAGNSENLATALAAGQVLSGAEIRAKIVGNTLIGKEDETTVVEFFKDDGSILGQGDDGKYAGSWRIKGDKLCVQYDDDKAGTMDCLAMAINGDQITRLSAGDDVNDEDNDDIWTLKAGNSENLTTVVVGGQTLSGAQIREKIIHNTLVGTEDGAPVAEYYNDDGIILGKGSDGNYVGLWRIQGDKLCVAYDEDDEDASQGLDCMTVLVSGDKVALLAADDDIADLDSDDLWVMKNGNPELLTSADDD